MDSGVPIPRPLRARTGPVPAAGYSGRGCTTCMVSKPQALIIDDCRFIAERVARTLEARGFECTVAADGFAGLGLARARRLALVVLDVDMPFVDGFTVLRQLRRDPVHAETPVLMLAAERSEADHDRAVALGANGYLAKPLQLRPLNAMVDSLLR